MNRIVIAAALIATATLAHANPTVEKSGQLTSKDGRSLYTFDKDSLGKSTCTGTCNALWPAFGVANAALADAEFSIVKREDGTQQWAYKNMPLYFYAGDAKPGDVNGDNQGGVWHLLRGTGKSAAATPRQDSTSYNSTGYGY